MWRHRLFTLCSALSLLLCAAVCGLWVRSHYRIDQVRRNVGQIEPGGTAYWQSVFHAVSYGGVLRVSVGRVAARRPSDEDMPAQSRRRRGNWAYRIAILQGSWEHDYGWRWVARRPLPIDEESTLPALSEHLGFFSGYVRRNGPDGRQLGLAVGAPHSAVAAALALLPSLWLRAAWRRRRQVARGLCLRCGYDLRATPERCPECGTPAKRRVERREPGNPAPA